MRAIALAILFVAWAIIGTNPAAVITEPFVVLGFILFCGSAICILKGW